MLVEQGESVTFQPAAEPTWGPRRLRALLGRGLGSAFDAAAIRAIAAMMDRSPLGDFEISRARVEALVEAYGRAELLSELALRPPKLVIIARRNLDPADSVNEANVAGRFPRLAELLARNYHPVDSIGPMIVEQRN